MQFVHETRAKQRIVQLAAAFAEQTSNLPFLAQPPKRRAKIDLLFTANSYVGNLPQFSELSFVRATRRENDDWRKAVAENFRGGINRAGAGGILRNPIPC